MKQRIITGVIAAALFIPIVFFGSLPFALLVYALATVGAYELMKMNSRIKRIDISIVISFALLWVLLLPSNQQLVPYTEDIKYYGVLIATFALLIYTVTSKNRFNFPDVGFLLAVVLYVGVGFFYFIETRIAGVTYVFYALFIIWATDSGAYFIGRKFGKRKLWPEISPNKTIEGSIGGVIIAIIVAVLYKYIIGWEMNVFYLIAITVVASVMGQLGDLVQSAYKRHYGVKDSGNMLPGHGGILDRFDSLLFVLPVLHLLQFI